MNRLRGLLLLACFFVFESGPIFAATQDGPVRASMRVDQQVSGTKLRFKVANMSNATVTLHRSELPWASSTAVILSAVNRRRIPLRAVTPIFDVVDDSIVQIAPFQHLEGDIDLSDRLPSLQTELCSTSVIVFWYYAARSSGDRPLGESGGWHRFAQRADCKGK